MVVRLEFCEWVSITKGRNSSHLKRKTFRHIKEFRTVNHHLRSRTNRAEQERPELTRPRAPLKIILPLSLARLCIIWTSNELSRKVCSRINDRNLAWMVEIRFRSVYNAMVCSQSFQFANHSTKVLTWSRNSVWCAGFMSLAKDKPWNRRKISLIFAHKNGQKLTRAHIRKCLKHTYMKANWGMEALPQYFFQYMDSLRPNTCAVVWYKADVHQLYIYPV